ncbi:VMAP-C domain-containing protein [Streptomyces echinatus]|uniref:vWA-MoxR associated protein C-terminal domain-containing protein n=1 Tax=Streptomyces echinatus TaxID=67293 RepID=A0A7W9Q183_9ACTN|nr:hypothetical protein [Streptomyces echinatus]MBB5930987.1 hypothetical protein [Streptomyces echinatus]
MVESRGTHVEWWQPAGPEERTGQQGDWDDSVSDVLRTALTDVDDVRGDAGFRRELLASLHHRTDLPDWKAPAQNDRGEDDIAGLVNACRKYREPRTALAAVDAFLQQRRGNERAVAWFGLCVHAVVSPGILGTARMHQVYAALRKVERLPESLDVARYAEACRTARLNVPLTGATDLFRALERLNDAQRGPGARPAIHRFLQLLAQDLPEPARSALAEAAGEPLPAAGPRPAPRPAEIIVQLRLEEVEAAPSETPRYQVHGAFYSHEEGLLSELDSWIDDRQVTKNDLLQHGSTLLSGWGDLAYEMRDYRTRVRFEFLLPWSLLDHAVDLWTVTPYVLGHQYPVVVRSLDRHKNFWMHAMWRRRWDQLAAQVCPSPPASATDDIAWMTHLKDRTLPAGSARRFPSLQFSTLSEVTQWLKTHSSLACIGLGFAYGHPDAIAQRAIEEAVAKGIPVLVWRRDDGDPCELDVALRDRDLSRLDELPLGTRSLREAAETGTSNDLGRHITLLWDDPNCVAELQHGPYQGVG